MESEMNSSKPKIYQWLNTLYEFPLPPLLKKNIVVSISKIIGAAAEVPIEKLKAYAANIKAKSAADVKFIEGSGKIANTELRGNDEASARALDYFLERNLQFQLNRERITKIAMDELKETSPTKDPENEIDGDWLLHFSKIAETKSAEEIQLVLGKLLAGEIAEPGSFSLKTLHLLSILDHETARIFSRFCNLCMVTSILDDASPLSLLHGDFGEIDDNAFGNFGLDYREILVLQDAGLIFVEHTVKSMIPRVLFAYPFAIGTRVYAATNRDELMKQFNNIDRFADEESKKLKCTRLTKAGEELMKVLTLSTVEEYNEGIIKYLEKVFELKFVVVASLD